MQLKEFKYGRDKNRWDEFVRRHPDATFFHLSDWHDIIDVSYRSFQPRYRYVEQAGEIIAVLPVTEVRRPLISPALISNPFAVSAGVLCRDPGSESEVLEALANENKDTGYLEIRGTHSALPEAWQTSNHFVNFEKRLAENHDQNLSEIPNRQRAVIRKADKHNLELTFHDDLERFHRVYSLSLRNLGTPIYPKIYFRKLFDHFAESICLVSVSHQGQDLTTALCFKFNDRLMPYYGGGVPQARDFNAYPWMYWQLMQWGVNNSLPVFDFGRSPNQSGPYAFKKNLGFSPTPLNYSFLPLKGKSPDLTGTSPVARQLISLWQKLPVSLTKVLGPVGAIYAV